MKKLERIYYKNKIIDIQTLKNYKNSILNYEINLKP